MIFYAGGRKTVFGTPRSRRCRRLPFSPKDSVFSPGFRFTTTIRAPLGTFGAQHTVAHCSGMATYTANPPVAAEYDVRQLHKHHTRTTQEQPQPAAPKSFSRSCGAVVTFHTNTDWVCEGDNPPDVIIGGTTSNWRQARDIGTASCMHVVDHLLGISLGDDLTVTLTHKLRVKDLPKGTAAVTGALTRESLVQRLGQVTVKLCSCSKEKLRRSIASLKDSSKTQKYDLVVAQRRVSVSVNFVHREVVDPKKLGGQKRKR